MTNTDDPNSPGNSNEDFSKANAQDLASNRRSFWPISTYRSSDGLHVSVNWTRLAVLLFLSGIVVWLALATTAFYFVKYQRGFTDVKWSHMAMLPLKWEDYQRSRGDFYIKTAKLQLEEVKYREAFYSLRVGVNKSPANKDGRLLLSQFYSIWRRPELAEQTLLQGLSYHSNDLDYLKAVFSFLLRQQRDEKVLELYDTLLGGNLTHSDRNRLIALAASTASFFRGNYDRADSLIETYALKNTRDGRLILARIDWERGDRDLSLEKLKSLGIDFPKDDEIYAQIGAYLRELGRFAEARRESLVRSLNYPTDAQSRIDLLYAFTRENDLLSLKSGIEEIIRDFSANSAVLMALADYAANTGDMALATRIYNITRAKNLDWERAALMTVEAHIVAKQYQSAIEMVRVLLKDNPDWAKRYYSVFNGLQAIAFNGLGDSEAAQVFLNNYLGQNTIRADDLVAVSTRLVAVGAYDQARQVLNQAVKTDPLNQAALTNLVKLEIDANNADSLTQSVRKLLTMRKPSRNVLSDAYDRLASDVFLFFPDRSAVLQELQSTLEPAEKRG